MILQALTKLYERLDEEGLVAQQGFKRVDIPFLITLNMQGDFVGLAGTRTLTGKKLRARSFIVPQEQERSGSKAWQKANLLWDHYGYVFGWPKADDEKAREMAEKQHQTFVAEILKLHKSYPDDLEIGAVFRFLSSQDFSAVFNHAAWQECIKIPGCNISFMIEGQTQLVCENENVKAYIGNMSDSTIDSDDDDDDDQEAEIEGTCLITGEYGPIARLHPRTPIFGAKSNSKIVAFQKSMGFDSYGKQQSYNAPTGKKATFAFSTALNTLLAKDSHRKLQVGDATAVFWAGKPSVIEDVFADFFGEPAKENPEQQLAAIRALYAAPQTGTPPLEQEDDTSFYVLGLAPNAARITIRFWYDGTVSDVVRHIRQHFNDCALVHGPKYPQYLSLFRLLCSTALQGKYENILANMAGDMMKAILAGTPYPQTLLATTVRRCRAEREITYPRAALIKAILTRATRYYQGKEKEVDMALDPENTNIGYRLGRLFAVLEKIQEEASPGINATIRDRHYGAASGTPATAFSQLMKLKNHHLAKLENRGRAVNLERIIGSIMDSITDFPTLLNLQDQGRFAVGYYHQRQDFYKKNDILIANKSQEAKI